MTPRPEHPTRPFASRVRGPLLIGLGLVCVLVVAVALVVATDRLTVPDAEVAAETTEAAVPSPSGYSTFSDEYVVLRHPRGWDPLDATEGARRFQPGTLSEFRFTSPSGEHQVCLSVFELEEDEERTAREHQEGWESDLMEYSSISEWQRLSLEEVPSAPPGWDTSHMEVTYHNSGWDQPDRWMLWRYTVIAKESRGYYLQFNVPASEQEEYAPVVEEVFGSFEPVL
ncbi:hypothetical protein NOSIN_03260 [Nocardiopsis sinuspersici]|uniref:Uncharacterized protein n=1 Tax=Nocardiopsis sinuspersici TaxID=501010 RepID=A0A1V3BXI2_9ACTN|nr:hypothetical protein NOSIN_03260 [Nocardiopsis sinuspersici]